MCVGLFVCLHAGGMAPVIVDADTDIDYAVSRIVFGAFYYQGQSCISVQNIYVHEARPVPVISFNCFCLRICV